MSVAIDTSRIEAMVTQLKTMASRSQATSGATAPTGIAPGISAGNRVGDKPDFADALKAQLDQVNGAQQKAEQLGQRFTLGDDSVNLSDVMIASQKANIGFQATIQVRNKLVSAYHDIMAMQV
jgi:flagellar hook-basal body complex protein FliE